MVHHQHKDRIAGNGVRVERIRSALRAVLGYAYRNLKRYAEAQVAYQRALSLDPKFAPAHHGLGLPLVAFGNEPAAQEELKLLQTLDTDWAKKLRDVIA